MAEKAVKKNTASKKNKNINVQVEQFPICKRRFCKCFMREIHSMCLLDVKDSFDSAEWNFVCLQEDSTVQCVWTTEAQSLRTVWKLGDSRLKSLCMDQV